MNGAPGFHAITVQLADPAKRADDVLRYRSGYYAR
jgi:hypothetical protein